MNKSELAVLAVIRGEENWRTLYSKKTGQRKKRIENAIDSLKKKKIIYKDKYILREL
jgi:hypothetical protein